jgi:ribonuclease T2
MLRPHLLLTFLVFVAICAYGTHFFSQRRTSWPSPSSTSADTNGSAGSGAGTSGKVEPSRPISNVQSTKQAYNEDDQDRTDSSDDNGNQQNVPGQFDYYALVLSWSPTYCADDGRDDDTQCNRRDGWRYSFILHGLWPQYESGYPSNCRLPRRPFVPDQVINSMLDIMPSRGLVIHEYRTHGTCSGLDPISYFTTAHRLFDRINIPERFRNPFEPQILSARDVERAFLQANPEFRPDMIAVACGGAGGMLREVRLCLSKEGVPRGCGQNETRRSLCTANQVFVPPTRSTAKTWKNEQQIQLPTPPKGNSGGGDHLPGPQMNFDYGRRTQ